MARQVDRNGSFDSRSHGPEDASSAYVVMAMVVLMWGLGPPVQKSIAAPALIATAIRLWASVPLFLSIGRVTGERWTARAFWRSSAAGLCFAANLTMVFIALKHTSVAVVAVLQAMQPGVVLILAGRWLGERASFWHVAWTAVGTFGVIVVVLAKSPDVSGDVLGTGLAVASVIVFSAYHVLSRRARAGEAIGPSIWMAGVSLWASVFIVPCVLVANSVSEFTDVRAVDWGLLAFMTVVVGVLGHGLMSWVHSSVPASRSALCTLGMTVVAVIAAWPLHDEPITVGQAVGALIVIGAIAAVLSRATVVVVTPATSIRV